MTLGGFVGEISVILTPTTFRGMYPMSPTVTQWRSRVLARSLE